MNGSVSRAYDALERYAKVKVLDDGEVIALGEERGDASGKEMYSVVERTGAYTRQSVRRSK